MIYTRHKVGKLLPDQTQRCTLCGEVIADYRHAMSDGPIGTWPEGFIYIGGNNPIELTTELPKNKKVVCCAVEMKVEQQHADFLNIGHKVIINNHSDIYLQNPQWFKATDDPLVFITVDYKNLPFSVKKFVPQMNWIPFSITTCFLDRELIFLTKDDEWFKGELRNYSEYGFLITYYESYKSVDDISHYMEVITPIQLKYENRT